MSGATLAGRLLAVSIFTLAAAGVCAADQAPFSMLGNTMSLQVSGAQTHDASSTIVVDVVPGHEPPPHIHMREDEPTSSRAAAFVSTAAAKRSKAARAA